MRILLIGNPNSGKTTVFNHLTGSHQHIGNFPGVTVEFKKGHYGPDEIIDLPGLYSLTPQSEEERITVQFLRQSAPDGIINCVDITNLRRSLLLTLTLAELHIPMILIANMLEECSTPPELQELEEKLGIPIFPIHRQNRWAPAVLMRLIRSEIEHKHTPPLRCMGDRQAKFLWIDQHIPSVTARRARSKTDRLFMHPLWGTFIFVAIILMIFYITFYLLGPPAAAFLSRYPQKLIHMASAIDIPPLRIVIQGAISGVGSVFSFLPMIALLYFFLSFLEDSGYMVRVCYLTEHIMDRIGLSGKSTVPLLLGLGCTVPAALAARISENTLHQKRTLQLLPYFSCSAKLPVYSAIASMIAPHHSFYIVLFCYGLGIAMGFLFTALSKKQRIPLLLELPPYRIPNIKNLSARIWNQISGFISKAFTVLLGAAILTAILENYTPALHYTEDPSKSILARIGQLPEPLFRPAGLGDWRLISALFAGLFAKESILSVLAVLTAGGGIPGESLLPFLVFIVLYPPCFTALNTLYKETNSFFFVARLFFTHILLAYIAALFSSYII